MYLTRFALNPQRRGSRTLLGSPQAMHAAVLASFEPDAEEPPLPGRVLWRLDEGENTRRDLFIASPREPDLTHLVEQAGWPTTSTWQTRDYRPLLGRLANGQRWAFRLTANPVRSVRLPDKKNTQPIGHKTVLQQRQWLLDRVEGLGFDVEVGDSGEPQVTVSGRRTLRFSRQGANVTLTQATYDGILTVTDADRLRHALIHGIGRGKGYGCGLLTLAPLS